MKTIGVLGGMSWESTVTYYRLINEGIRARLGGFHSAKLLLHSVDFHEIEALQRAGDWDESGRLLGKAARSLELAGADFLLLATNTMHKVTSAIEDASDLPLLHIGDATADALRKAGIGSVGLLGTRFTMEEDFYRDRLSSRHGLQVSVPDAADRAFVHRVIYEELCFGRLLEDSREGYREVIGRLVEGGAEAIVLGCTEISLLVGPDDVSVPLFDTTAIHARAAVEWALGDG